MQQTFIWQSKMVEDTLRVSCVHLLAVLFCFGRFSTKRSCHFPVYTHADKSNIRFLRINRLQRIRLLCCNFLNVPLQLNSKTHSSMTQFCINSERFSWLFSTKPKTTLKAICSTSAISRLLGTESGSEWIK